MKGSGLIVGVVGCECDVCCRTNKMECAGEIVIACVIQVRHWSIALLIFEVVLRVGLSIPPTYAENVNEMFTHMHYRVLGVGSLRVQGPV